MHKIHLCPPAYFRKYYLLFPLFWNRKVQREGLENAFFNSKEVKRDVLFWNYLIRIVTYSTICS